MNEPTLPRSLARWWWAAVTGSALLTLVLGPWGFWLYALQLRQTPSVWDVIYRTLQLFVLGGDAITGAVPLPLQAARFLAAFVAFSTVALALLRIFHDRLQFVRLRFFRDHILVCGLGPMGAGLVQALRRQGIPVVVLEVDQRHEGIPRCRDAGAVVLSGPTTDEWFLRQVGLARARALVTLFQDDATNLRTALLARQMNTTRTQGSLKCVAQVTKRDLRNLLLRQDLVGRAEDPFQLELFNHYEVMAQAMLEHNPALYAGKELQRFLLVGLGALGESLLLRAVRDWRIDGPRSGPRRSIIAIDRDAARHALRIHSDYPFLEEVCDLEYHSLNVLAPQFEKGAFLSSARPGPPIDVAFICLSDESVALAAAVRLAKLLAGQQIPIILRLDSETGADVLIQGHQLQGVRAVGLREVLVSPALVLDATREALAQAIHAQYGCAESTRGTTPAVNPALVPWHELPEDLKNSNRDQAGHIPVKLRAASCRLVPVDEARPLFTFTDVEVEKLARLEHERWCQERRQAGWRLGPVKDLGRRLHPSLVPWEQLDAVDQERDRHTVRHIPFLAAKAGFAIIRDVR
jgi:voltage-gated potassium channel Kch